MEMPTWSLGLGLERRVGPSGLHPAVDRGRAHFYPTPVRRDAKTQSILCLEQNTIHNIRQTHNVYSTVQSYSVLMFKYLKLESNRRIPSLLIYICIIESLPLVC